MASFKMKSISCSKRHTIPTPGSKNKDEDEEEEEQSSRAERGGLLGLVVVEQQRQQQRQEKEQGEIIDTIATAARLKSKPFSQNGNERNQPYINSPKPLPYDKYSTSSTSFSRCFHAPCVSLEKEDEDDSSHTSSTSSTTITITPTKSSPSLLKEDTSPDNPSASLLIHHDTNCKISHNHHDHSAIMMISTTDLSILYSILYWEFHPMIQVSLNQDALLNWCMAMMKKLKPSNNNDFSNSDDQSCFISSAASAASAASVASISPEVSKRIGYITNTIENMIYHSFNADNAHDIAIQIGQCVEADIMVARSTSKQIDYLGPSSAASSSSYLNTITTAIDDEIELTTTVTTTAIEVTNKCKPCMKDDNEDIYCGNERSENGNDNDRSTHDNILVGDLQAGNDRKITYNKPNKQKEIIEKTTDVGNKKRKSNHVDGILISNAKKRRGKAEERVSFCQHIDDSRNSKGTYCEKRPDDRQQNSKQTPSCEREIVSRPNSITPSPRGVNKLKPIVPKHSSPTNCFARKRPPSHLIPMLCRFYAKGQCHRGKDCPFLHDFNVNDVSAIKMIKYESAACMFFREGYCRDGEHCLYKH